MKFLGMGVPELIIILVVILLIFGPKNLPKLGKAFGKSVSSLREGMNEGKKKAEGEETEATAEDADVAEGESEGNVAPAALEAAAEEVEDAADAPETEAEVTEPAQADAPKKVVKVVRKKTDAE